MDNVVQSVTSLHAQIVAIVAFLSIAGAEIFIRFARRRDRIIARRDAKWIWRAAIGVAALAFSPLRLNGSSGSVVEAIGYFVGLASGAITMREYFTRTTRSVQVVYIAKANNGFTQMIASGVRDRLTKADEFTISEVYPEPDAAETSAGILQRIHSGDLDKADSVIMVLGEITDDLRSQINRLIKRGTQVVLCDAFVERDYFYERNVVPPAFISTDFIEGGRIVGRAMNSRWAPDVILVVFCGPNFNGPAYQRARETLYTLEEPHGDHGERDIWTVFTTNWAAKHLTEKFEEQVLHRLERLDAEFAKNGGTPPKRTVSVYCGNDESAILFSQRIMTTNFTSKYTFELYGFDGLRDSTGELAIRAWPNIVFTVDTQPKEIGRTSASFILDKAVHRMKTGNNNIILKPTGVFVV